jgi:hypothetical protein
MAHVGSRQYPKAMDQVRSRQRVIDHGEVFTPQWMVDAMLDLANRRIRRKLDPQSSDQPDAARHSGLAKSRQAQLARAKQS